MGLIGEVLLLPAAPVRGIGWVLRQVVEVAEREYYDPSVIRQELKRLEEELTGGLIGDEEFDRREDALLDRLEAATQWQATHRRSG
jgi:Gas vesicle protein G